MARSGGNIHFGDGGATWRIGNRGTVGGFLWTGLIDEVLLYNRTLNPSEIYKYWQIKRGGIFQRKPIVAAKAVAAPAGGTVHPLVMGSTNLLRGKI